MPPKPSRAKIAQPILNRDPVERQDRLVQVLDMCHRVSAEDLRAHGDILGSAFTLLVRNAEKAVRARLAEQIQHADWAPLGLVEQLARDEIDVARHVISGSPVLKDADLIGLLLSCSVDHQIAVASRPQLGAAVVDVILCREEASVWTALASNDTAVIDRTGMDALIEASERIVSLRAPLVRHPRLEPDLAERLYNWVGQSLKLAIAARFKLDLTQLEVAVASAVTQAKADGQDQLQSLLARALSDEMITQLIEKLHSSGQLTPATLVRMLLDGRLSMFLVGLAKLGRFDLEDLRRAIDSDRPELLALACAAVRIDRSVFPTILRTVRGLNHGRPKGGVQGDAQAQRAFGPFGPDVHAKAFRHAAQSA